MLSLTYDDVRDIKKKTSQRIETRQHEPTSRNPGLFDGSYHLQVVTSKDIPSPELSVFRASLFEKGSGICFQV